MDHKKKQNKTKKTETNCIKSTKNSARNFFFLFCSCFLNKTKTSVCMRVCVTCGCLRVYTCVDVICACVHMCVYYIRVCMLCVCVCVYFCVCYGTRVEVRGQPAFPFRRSLICCHVNRAPDSFLGFPSLPPSPSKL